MDIRQLRSFVAVVDYQSFSRAAEKLNITQSSVSTHLLQLEKELGSKLLNRTTKTLEVTDTGWKVYQYASHILELEDCAQQACSANGRNILRIGATGIPATYILPGMLYQYRALYPNDCVKVKECDNKTIIEGILDKRFDSGLIDHMVCRSGITCVPLCYNRSVLVTPATERYLQMKQQGVSMTELLKEPVILWENDSGCFRDQMGIDTENLRVVARVSNYETVKNMVCSGMGISIVPEVAARDAVCAHRLLSFELPDPLREWAIYLVYSDNCTVKDKIWNFIDYLLESKNLLRNM